MNKTDDLITDIKSKVQISPRPTTDEVDQVLSLIAPPREHRDLKVEILLKLYPHANNVQGLHFSSYMSDYPSF